MSWADFSTARLPMAVTIRDIMATTGLSRRTVRDLIAGAGLRPVPGYGRHGALSYATSDVLSAVARRPGKGNRWKSPPTPTQNDGPPIIRPSVVVLGGAPYLVQASIREVTS